MKESVLEKEPAPKFVELSVKNPNSRYKFYSPHPRPFSCEEKGEFPVVEMLAAFCGKIYVLQWGKALSLRRGLGEVKNPNSRDKFYSPHPRPFSCEEKGEFPVVEMLAAFCGKVYVLQWSKALSLRRGLGEVKKPNSRDKFYSPHPRPFSCEEKGEFPAAEMLAAFCGKVYVLQRSPLLEERVG